jgi:sialic acid synthase SpsE
MIELIAECTTGHGGSVGRAIQFIERFAAAGANIIKFQYTRHKRLKLSDPQYEWFKQAELSDRDFDDLADYTATTGAHFMLTVYHPDDVPSVRQLTPFVKVGSGEAHSTKLAEAVYAAGFHRVYVSSGIRPPMHWYSDNSHGAIVKRLACVSRYPHPAELVSARLLEGFCDGWSDHCVGLDGCMTAIALGAKVIEKHVQIREQARPPQPWEATVDEFTQLREWADLSPDRFLERWNNG